ncbi:hypothetical protein [Chiayiivirga flava]|uniref:DUF732 domain-containing protein n=1 Tax=Chiayiivirga flava TaxID=659595 RepID=A0A7W8G1A4_9GAMM|nr:hypothetical protein [Chiayiivirga flava]MBB5208643.1 hypothetical protein [Chiayiivirga flava]
MIRRPLTAAVAVLLLATAACSDTTPADTARPDTARPDTAVAPPPAAATGTDAPPPDLPALPEPYRRTLTRAFGTAAEGRDPTMACTSVIARAAGNPPPDGGAPTADAVRAFELCYVDVRARYIEHVMDEITPQTPADVRDTACLKIISHAIIARSSLGTFAKNVSLDVATLDRTLADRVRGSVQPLCPDQFATLEGQR